MTPPRDAYIPVRSSQMPATFPRLFEAQVERMPGATAKQELAWSIVIVGSGR